jgi:hypothetical protein
MAHKLVRRVQPEPEKEEEEAEGTPSDWKPTPLLYDVDDACFILGKISKQKIYNLVNLGQLKRVKIGTRSLFTPEELQRFVDERVQESVGE